MLLKSNLICQMILKAKDYPLIFRLYPNICPLALITLPAHREIESDFFEFRKMKAFLEMGVSVRVFHVPEAPIDKAQEYVNSLLLVDLISVLDRAIDHFFDFNKLKQKKHKSKFTILEEAKQFIHPRNLEWYRSWRHETAHKGIRHEWYKVNQATEHVAQQFAHWGLLTGKLNFKHHYKDPIDGVVRIGSRIGDIPILEYKAWSIPVPVGVSASSQKTIDLSFEDFINSYNDTTDGQNL